MKGVVSLELKRELQAAVAPAGPLGKAGCDNESAAVRRALRELLDSVSEPRAAREAAAEVSS